MCSIWVTMEHDEGDLEAVVRAGRGLVCSSFLGRNLNDNNNNTTNGNNNNNPSYNSWQSTATVGVEAGSTCFRGLQGAAPDDGGSVQRNSSQMVFPNLLRTAPAPAASPPGMDLQGLCSIPFYNGNILLRSASSAASSMFENVDVQQQACRFGAAGGRADSPTASMFASAQDMRPNEQLNVEKKLCHSEEEFGRNPTSAFAPADSGLTDVPVSKPLEAAAVPAATTVNTSRKVEGGDANSPLAHPKSEPGSVDSGMSTPTGPSPKNPGSKRRKTQQKRIVCVPAAGGSNRPSGEGLPSDLWAWRKYGQKPIKGSPYPRGYYRCSSSKGCSARKQVERSRTDPTMLVITYTSDHNHPWPTHRNALAGSTRQSNSAEKIASAVSQSHETTTTDNNTINNAAESSEAMAAENPLNSSSIDSPAAGADQSGHGDNQTPNFNIQEDDEEQAGGLDRLFGATASGHPHHDDDFFADLGELPESLNVLALRHFDDDKSDDEAAGSMSMSSSTVADPFNLFNWSSATFVDTETAM